jgi:hypothetical protein
LPRDEEERRTITLIPAVVTVLRTMPATPFSADAALAAACAELLSAARPAHAHVVTGYAFLSVPWVR